MFIFRVGHISQEGCAGDGNGERDIGPAEDCDHDTCGGGQRNMRCGAVDCSAIHVFVWTQKIEFEVDAGMLRVSGVNVVASDAVKLGAHHTVEIELARAFTVEKDEWDSVALARVEEACDPARSAEIAAVVMGEGTASVCLITDSMTVVRARIDMQIPRKRRLTGAAHDKSVTKFFEAVLQAVLANIDFEHVKCVIVASPAFTKDQFLEYMHAEAVRRHLTAITTHRGLFLPVHCTSGHLVALKEILEDETIMARISDTKASGEVALLREFFDLMKNKPDNTVYGLKHVEKALQLQAIRTLLLTDALFRSSNIATRKQYVALVDAVRATGAEVKIFSSLHVSGQRLCFLISLSFTTFTYDILCKHQQNSHNFVVLQQF